MPWSDEVRADPRSRPRPRAPIATLDGLVAALRALEALREDLAVDVAASASASAEAAA